MNTPVLSRLLRSMRAPSEIDEPIQPQAPNASVTTAINGLALVSAVMISSGFSWVKTTTTATMTSSMVIIERQEKRASVTGSADSAVSSSIMVLMWSRSSLSSCLSHVPMRVWGRGPRLLNERGQRGQRRVSPSFAAAATAGFTPISAANNASS